MESPDFSNQRKRLKRANDKAAELGVAIRQWADGKPFSFEPKISDDRLSWSLYLRVHKKPPIEDWGFMFGETIQHLRSVLENIVVTIAESTREITPEEKRSLQFPITTNVEEWKKNKSRVAILPDKYQKAIENIQPYQRIHEGGNADQDPLLLLRELSNSDKHHIQVIPVMQQKEINHGIAVEFHSEEEAAKNVPPNVTINIPQFVDNALLLKQTTINKIARLHGNANIGMQLQVEWNPGKYVELTFCVGGLCYYTGVILEYLAAVKQQKFTIKSCAGNSF